jgi:molybdopterin-binding protein
MVFVAFLPEVLTIVVSRVVNGLVPPSIALEIRTGGFLASVYTQVATRSRPCSRLQEVVTPVKAPSPASLAAEPVETRPLLF